MFVAPWLAPFPILTGAFTLALFVFLAAVYLAYGASDASLQETFRRRALASSLVVLVLASTTLALGYRDAPRVARGIGGSAWALPLHLLTGIAAILAIAALAKRRYAIARVAAGAQVTFILWGWVLSQYPFIVPETWTIRDSAAPRETLSLLFIGLAVGTLILAPALRYLYRLFGAPSPQHQSRPIAAGNRATRRRRKR